jgi:hypothetical protein
MSVSRNPGRSHVSPAAVTSLRLNRYTSANCWNTNVAIATCRPRIRSDGSPTTAAVAPVTAIATSSTTGQGAPRLPTLMAVNAPTPRNAAWASDSSPARATSTSSPSAAMAVTMTPTMIDSRTSFRPSDDHTTSAATATTAAMRAGILMTPPRCRAGPAVGSRACRSRG